MSTTDDVNAHFEMMMQAVHDAHRDVIVYLRDSDNWTDAAKNTHRVKITTIRTDLVHPANCAICTGWE